MEGQNDRRGGRADITARTKIRTSTAKADLQARIRKILTDAAGEVPPQQALGLTFGERAIRLGRIATTFARPWARPISDAQADELRAIAKTVARARGMPAVTIWAPVKRILGVQRIDAIPRGRLATARRLLIDQGHAPKNRRKTNVVRLGT